MNMRILVATFLVTAAGLAGSASGHCDTLDGPVARAGREALEKGDVTPALRWVKADGEKEIKTAFDKAKTVRGLGQNARDLADSYFLETLVRVHRAGEGEPYTGLKPADAIPAGIALADRSVAGGDAEGLVKQVTADVTSGIRARFAAVMAKKQQADQSVEAGREYVAAYVAFIHHVEGLVGGAHAEAAPSAAPAHEH